MSIQAVAWVLDHSESRGVTRLVLISLANHADKETGECWPSVRSIANEAGVGKSTVARHIERLVSLGELEILEAGDYRHSARYRLTKVASQSGTQSPREERRVPPRAGQNHQEPKDEEASSSNGSVPFADFHAKRAAEAVRERKRKGLSVLSPGGLARAIQQDPEFVAESERIWEHRDCERCEGKGEISAYSPGAGMTSVPCDQPKDDQ